MAGKVITNVCLWSKIQQCLHSLALTCGFFNLKYVDTVFTAEYKIKEILTCKQKGTG